MIKVKPLVIALACALAASVGLNIGQHRQRQAERRAWPKTILTLEQMHAIAPAKHAIAAQGGDQ